MTSLAEETIKMHDMEKELLKELAKGIDDIENGRTISHEDAMQALYEGLEFVTQ